MKSLIKGIRTSSIVLIVAASFFFNGCEKNETTNVERFGDNLIVKLNEFNPSNSEASQLASSFIKARKNPTLKNTIEDKNLDEGIWVTEAFINYEKGFKKDSIDNLVIDTIYYEMPIKNWNNEIPVIDGSQLISLNDFLINRIDVNEENEYLFWATYINIVELDESTAQIEIINAGGPRSYTISSFIAPKPPDALLTPFPEGYTTKAGYPPTPMLWAERDYWNKISGPRSAMSGDYALVHAYNFHKGAYISPGVADPRLFWDYGQCEQYFMSTAQLNQFLFSSKDLIDANNPAVASDEYMIGYFLWHCWNYGEPYVWAASPDPDYPYTYAYWFEHAVEFHIFRIVCMPPIED